MADYVQRQFEHEFESYKKMIEYVNAEVLSYNDNLHSAALRLLEKRKKESRLIFEHQCCLADSTDR